MHSNLFTFVLILSFIIYSSGQEIYSFTVKDSSHENISLDQYKGKVLLIVNVASHCGYTETTYRGLDRLQDILGYGGLFSVLAFPCNQFGDQEPGTIEEIEPAMKEAFNIEFPLFDKIDVIGSNASPLFRYLIEQTSVVPEWNFFKYLVDSTGDVIKAYDTKTTIEDLFDDVNAAILLAKDTRSDKVPTTQRSNSEESAKDKDEL